MSRGTITDTLVLFVVASALGCSPTDSHVSSRDRIIINKTLGQEKVATNMSSESASSPNHKLLHEVNMAASWFHAKKTRPIWAKRLERPQRVRTLEGEEDVPAGAYLCRGEAGDIWPQTAERLEAKYVGTEETSSDGWHKYNPRPDDLGVMAAQVDHPFAVQAKWGRLDGKAGDFVVKNYDDRDNSHPDDLWIVDKDLFDATYERVK